MTGSYDPDLNLTYWGVGNPGPDWNGDNREGANLYSCSVVALDGDTGKLKWFFQFSPHDEFDYDSVQVPVLADVSWQGQPRKVLFFANRNGYFYVLDRATGQFLFGKLRWIVWRDEPLELRLSFRFGEKIVPEMVSRGLRVMAPGRFGSVVNGGNTRPGYRLWALS